MSTARDTNLDRPLDIDAARRLLGLITGDEPLPERHSDPRFAWIGVPGYRPVGVCGAGATGVVFQVVRDGSDMRLAMKLFRPACDASTETRGTDAEKCGHGVRQGRQSSHYNRRAWREFELLSRLRLPTIPRVLDYGHHAGHFYIVTEFIHGSALDVFLRGHALRPGSTPALPVSSPGRLREAIVLLARIADAVQSLHDAGIIHRDIKPSNILIDQHLNPVLIDLGIAALVGQLPGDTLSPTSTPIGSPAFMAPEQARGDRDALSERSDVYGLGATAYLVISGLTPHSLEGSLIQVLARVAHDEPASLFSMLPMFPRDLSRVFQKAVAHRPGDRYSSAADFAADLRRWLDGLPLVAVAPSLFKRAARTLRNHPKLTTAAMCATALALTTGGALRARAWRRLPTAVTLAPDESRVSLLSDTDELLHQWDSGARYGIASYAFLPANGARGPRVMVAYRASASPPEASGHLCLYSAAPPFQLLWSSNTPASPLSPPRSWRVSSSPIYRIAKAEVADVFPEVDGPEIIALHINYPDCPTAIRVYGVDGEVLFEAWHWGRLYDSYWLSQYHTLVLCGVTNAVLASQLSPDASHRDQPVMVVFALKPERLVARDWLQDPSGSLHPLWYLGLMPAGAHDVVDTGQVHLEPAVSADLRSSHVRCLVPSARTSNGVPAMATWLLTCTGRTDTFLVDDSFPSLTHWPSDTPLRLDPLPGVTTLSK